MATADKEERQQVGARVNKTIYRQLKARAAMEGVRVQDLVEKAIEEFLKS
jgi:predicted HicB family RNase H-like nuclease